MMSIKHYETKVKNYSPIKNTSYRVRLSNDFHHIYVADIHRWTPHRTLPGFSTDSKPDSYLQISSRTIAKVDTQASTTLTIGSVSGELFIGQVQRLTNKS